MKQADFKAFGEALIGVHDYYRREHPNPFTVRIWWESLKAFELEAVQKAFLAHINIPSKDGQFMPSVASLKQLLQGSVSDSATAAWIKTTQAVQRVGTGTTVVFDDALIHRVIEDLGGWIWLGQQSEEEWVFVARNFEARYRAYAGRGERPEYPRKLVGHYDAHNGQQGFDEAKPTLIGDPTLARRVMEGGSVAPRLTVTPPGAGPKRLPKAADLRAGLGG